MRLVIVSRAEQIHWALLHFGCYRLGMLNQDTYTQVKTNAAFVRSTNSFLLVTGPDALSFMQGMVTNDLTKLTEKSGCEVAYLTAKGSMVAFGHAFKLPNGILLEVQESLKQPVLDFLNKYLISEDAEIAESNDYSLVHIIGDKAVEQRAHFKLTCDTPIGFDAVIEKEKWPELFETTSEVREVLRVEAGMPVFQIDMTEKTIPMEANLENALSYTKGCYIGQEVVARGTHRGQMNKKLMGFTLGSTAVPVGTELFVEERKVGWITSTVFSFKKNEFIALGYVHRDFLTVGTVLMSKEKVCATVCALPFL
jgi:folate-binding protein YgfZ